MESFDVNKLNTDEFGRVSGVFAYNKPAGVSSHDIVYKFRRHFHTKKVGHAGTLDPFADGLLIVLVGKATKLSDSFLNKDKTYKARILLGIETTSGDPEGDITNTVSSLPDLNDDNINSIVKSFVPSYVQHVPLFSSVKVNGKKLRELARQYKNFSLFEKDSKTFVNFLDDNKSVLKEVELPSKNINIYSINILQKGTVSKTELISKFSTVFGKPRIVDESFFKLNEYPYIDIEVSVSKGTYIRQLAIDIGRKMGIPSTLIALTRTKIGDLSIENTYSIDD